MNVGPVALICVTSILLGSTAVWAGDENQIWLRQTSPVGSLNGNDLSADQGGANSSSISGVGRNLISPLAAGQLRLIGYDPNFALQRGEGNSATLTITGTGGELQLLQSSNPLMPFVPGISVGNNTAVATATSGDLGAIVQIGAANTAALSLDGNANGLITQLGSGLNTDLDVGLGGTGVVTQIGRNSNTGTLTVAPGTTLNYTQIGNNIAPMGMQSVQIVNATNPGSISITQTAW